MARITNGGKAVDDKRRIEVTVAPLTGHSVVTVVISTRDGSSRIDRRLARWHINLTRADLAGHSTDDVLLAVLGMVMHRIEHHRADPADRQAEAHTNAAVGPGAPDGATGRVGKQDTLPAVWPTPASG